MNGHPWVLERDLLQDTAKKPRLFCIPYAGSGSAGYYRWKRLLPQLNVCPVHLPGRDQRMGEPPVSNGDELVAAMHAALRACVSGDPGQPYAIFGHSMGALLAFAWAARIEADGLPLPSAVIVSARAPRRREGPAPETWLRAGDDELLRSVDSRFGGNAHAVLQDPEMRAAFLPVLRADMHVVESVSLGNAPLSIPLYAACGEADTSVSAEEMQRWQDHTQARFGSATFPGGHFYHFAEGQVPLLQWASEVLAQNGTPRGHKAPG